MPETELHILLDQNVPFAVAVWLRTQRPGWLVRHVKDLGFEGRSDDFLFRWAQQEKAIRLTFRFLMIWGRGNRLIVGISRRVLALF